MDALRNANRNGLDGEFFNFLPPVVYGAGALVAVKQKKKSYQNKKAVDLAIKYPHKLTSEEQDEMIAKVIDEQRKLVDEKNNSKGVKKVKLNAELKGYDEYLNDLRKVRDELLAKEKEAVSKLKQQVENAPKPQSLEEKTKEDETIQSATLQNGNAQPTPTTQSKSNTLLYVGIGVVVLVGIVLIMRKK